MSIKHKLSDQSSSDDECIYGTKDYIDNLLNTNKYETLKDLIHLGKAYGTYISKLRMSDKRKRVRLLYNNTDLYKLYCITKYLQDLDNLIGMNSLKRDIVYQILYYLQNYNEYNDLMHTVIMGSPGCGKTELSKILANIYVNLSFLSKRHITFAKRSDLIGEYLGQTAVKTQNLLNSAKGGCLIIDEAYSLGNSDKKDSYSKECIDVINQFLTENKDDFICIIIGYEQDLKSCFFSYNSGLERRFPWKYKVEPYIPKEIFKIFKNQVHNEKWHITHNALDCKFFEDNSELFTNFGGDTEVLFTKCKMAHIRRIFGKKNIRRKTLTKDDIQKGFEMFIKHKNSKKKEEDISFMYT